jgi:hypothetical protein
MCINGQDTTARTIDAEEGVWKNLPMQDEHETSDMPGAVSNAR